MASMTRTIRHSMTRRPIKFVDGDKYNRRSRRWALNKKNRKETLKKSAA